MADDISQHGDEKNTEREDRGDPVSQTRSALSSWEQPPGHDCRDIPLSIRLMKSYGYAEAASKRMVLFQEPQRKC